MELQVFTSSRNMTMFSLHTAVTHIEMQRVPASHAFGLAQSVLHEGHDVGILHATCKRFSNWQRGEKQKKREENRRREEQRQRKRKEKEETVDIKRQQRRFSDSAKLFDQTKQVVNKENFAAVYCLGWQWKN